MGLNGRGFPDGEGHGLVPTGVPTIGASGDPSRHPERPRTSGHSRETETSGGREGEGRKGQDRLTV